MKQTILGIQLSQWTKCFLSFFLIAGCTGALSGQSPSQSRGYATTGILEPVMLPDTVPVDYHSAWGMVCDAQLNAFDKPIAFRAPFSYQGKGYYYPTAYYGGLREFCPYAKLGDMLITEGRFHEFDAYYELMCTRITLPNRTFEGVVTEIPMPQFTYPEVTATIVCVKDDSGFEIAIKDDEGNFIGSENGEVMIAGNSYPLQTRVRVEGDIVQDYQLKYPIIFYSTVAKSCHTTDSQTVVPSSNDINIYVQGTTIGIKAEKPIKSVYIYDMAGRMLFATSQTQGREFCIALKTKGHVLVTVLFADNTQTSKNIIL
ncbi:T9SS type A sorting domain-containing protein [Porphyromonas gingivalis]|uniref:T9SS type A sorting domain-containing protein n=1 Tax=Porphyromonas gingivalis TaxID=837 RepID=UPI00201178E4|nr:T9SS type A sorting domain-containing protein [Porphyromonas gingivalis]